MEQNENYWIELATAKGNLLRLWFISKCGSLIGHGNEEYMYSIYNVLIGLPNGSVDNLFENEFGNLNLSNNDVALIVRHSAYSDFSGDFNSIDLVTDEFCLEYYSWLKEGDSLNLLFTNNTELDTPDFI